MQRRPYGVLAGPLLVAPIHFAPVVAGVHLGIARGARDEAQRVAGLRTEPSPAVLEAKAVVDLPLEVVGGPAFFRTSPLERAYRDVRAGQFHPLTPEATLQHVAAGETART